MGRRVPLSRAAQLLPFTRFLDRIGARTERELERHKLPPGLGENANALVATRAMAAFVGDMARREGITDFGWRTNSRRLEEIPFVAREIRHSPTLLHALKTVCALAYHESSNIQVRIEERRDSIFFCYRGSVEFGSLGADDLSLMRTAIVISLVRCFVAPDWVPTDCAFAIDGELGPIAREELGDARIHRAPEYGWLRLPRSMLSRPPRALLPDATSSGSEDGPEPALDLVGSLVQAVRPLLVRGAPSIRDAAELTGTSVRSLQRELAHAGSSYRDVLLQVKLDAARELLRQPDLKIRDVAYETGFSAPAHFTRFFRALSGVTPREYRASHLQEPG